MFNFTEAYLHLNHLYGGEHNRIMDMPNFQYNNANIRYLYIRTGVHNILHISFSINREYAVCPFFILSTNTDNTYGIDTYIPEDVYSHISSVFYSNGAYSTNRFFSVLVEHILNVRPDNKATFIRRGDFEVYINQANYVPNNDQDLYYFWHLRKSNLGNKTIAHIKRTIPYPQSYEIMRYLRQIHRTLVFTNDFAQMHNLTIHTIQQMYESIQD